MIVSVSVGVTLAAPTISPQHLLLLLTVFLRRCRFRPLMARYHRCPKARVRHRYRRHTLARCRTDQSSCVETRPRGLFLTLLSTERPESLLCPCILSSALWCVLVGVPIAECMRKVTHARAASLTSCLFTLQAADGPPGMLPEREGPVSALDSNLAARDAYLKAS
jgi:hypothetical protein